jgi:SAM-dependent methyltransferase
MMLGRRDVFQYMECDGCGCLQLLNPPTDMTQYYPPDYTAFRSNGRSQPLLFGRLRRYLRKRRNQGFLGRRGWLNGLLADRYDYLSLKAFARLGADRKARILDVGCGTGTLLLDLRDLDYENLLGVDRFIPAPIKEANGVRVIKGGLEDLVGTHWDVIMFHHSFEHMADPLRVLQQTAALLAAGGRCLIRIPILGWAWKHYGVDWAQLDAPRHFFLHSERSFRLIAQTAGLNVVRLTYDSNEFQFWASELYLRGIPFLTFLEKGAPEAVFSKSRLRGFRRRAVELNSQGRGDSAVFDLIKL